MTDTPTPSNQGTWKHCKTIEPECKAKGYCVGHSRPTPSNEVEDSTPKPLVDDSEIILMYRKGELDPIKMFNLFIQIHLPDLYAHFIDSDENDAQFIREAIEHEKTLARIETAKKILNRGWCIPEMEVQVEDYIATLQKGEQDAR